MGKKRYNFDNIVQDLLDAEPFLPFTVIMGSGDKFRIEDPAMMVVTAVELIYVVPHSGRILRIRKTHIVAIEERSEKHAA